MRNPKFNAKNWYFVFHDYFSLPVGPFTTKEEALEKARREKECLECNENENISIQLFCYRWVLEYDEKIKL